MSATGLAIIYIIIWWIVFFAILPIDVDRIKIEKIEGEDPGSPENPKILKKFIYCTGITTILFTIIYLLMRSEYLNLRNIILVGHSQGCLEALEYSFKYKDRLKKIVFVGSSYRMPVHKDLINLASDGDSNAVKLMMKWGYEGSKKFIGGNPVEKIIQSPRDVSEILAVDLIACNNYQNGSDAAKAINCPTLFILGELDKMANLESGKKFANLVKDSTTYIIKGTGHMIMIEKAFEMREKILEFLNK